MDQVRIYLKNPLFSTQGDAHIPKNAYVLDGEIKDRPTGGLLVDVRAWCDGDGKDLKGEPRTLFLPFGKIDHAVVLEAG